MDGGYAREGKRGIDLGTMGTFLIFVRGFDVFFFV
jgi:hypothetical protein